ncbi:hypothetical protein Q1W73_13555 [Asticcacaulis sp. ZE23SCel15]|uniref:hypothetical protein n=1 Tax=Asticcacaulis sp. ZE23SCel15 TaxID=3059027 RepID=UPI00266058D3|nr:hypothetical protein [Asticcacaulis sp. ZE23SCel15]WKL56686.1 hypothetical protein Q1W73_13555 [Asticcacaulis sp. ZE23SCel15]
MSPPIISEQDVPASIKAELAKAEPDVDILRTWFVAEYQKTSGTPFDINSATVDDLGKFAGWLNFQILKVDLLVPISRAPRLQNKYFANYSSKVTSISQRGCLICRTGFPVNIVNVRLPPVSRQAIKGPHFKAMQAAFKERFSKLAGKIGKDERLCVAATFVLSPSKKRNDKDVDNMAKATMDALARAIGFNDACVQHLDIVKLTFPDSEEYMVLRIAPTNLQDHDDTIVPVQHHSWGGTEPINLDDWLASGAASEP